MDLILPIVVALLLAGLIALAVIGRARLEALQRELAARPAQSPPQSPPRTPPPEPAAAPEPAPEPAPEREDLTPRIEALEVDLGRLGTRLDDHEVRLDKARAWAQDVVGRLEALRDDVEALATRLPPPAPAEGEEPERAAEEVILAHLRREGLREIRLLEDPDDPAALRFEARRGGLSLKGRAAIDAQGHVVLRLAPTLRAFP